MLFCWMWLQVNNLNPYNLHSFNFRSNYSSGMRAHVRLVHLGVKPPLYSCWECDYQGSSKSVVIQNIHYLVFSESIAGGLSSHGNAHWSTERLPLAGLRLQIQVRVFLLLKQNVRTQGGGRQSQPMWKRNTVGENERSAQRVITQLWGRGIWENTSDLCTRRTRWPMWSQNQVERPDSTDLYFVFVLKLSSIDIELWERCT